MDRLVTPPGRGPHLPEVPHFHVNRPQRAFLQCKYFRTIFAPETSVFQNAKRISLKKMFYTYTSVNSQEIQILYTPLI